MKPFRLAFVGFLLQLLGIVAFILVSRTSEAALGKPVVIALVATFLVLLIWNSTKSLNLRGSLLYLPALLALGYIAAFHVVGFAAFHGLLRDWGISSDYFLSLLRTAVVAFALFAIAAALLLLLRRVIGSREGIHQN